MILKKKVTTWQMWQSLEALFRDNKYSRAIQLDNELNISMGTALSLMNYCTRIKTIADLLDNIDAAVPEKNLVTYTINGLSSYFDHVTLLIRHTSLLPTLLETRSKLMVEEQRMNLLQSHQNPHNDNSLFSVALIFEHSSNSSHNYRGGFNYGGRFGGRGRGHNSRGGGRNNPSMQIPAGWGYGWYPLNSSSKSSNSAPGLLPSPINVGPISSSFS
ncbi:uncharacterized protein LOC111905174 [Lactuca sativa]|uniref:uncharacterized protein LOC111905174 n=1 Tax=Lactuca sativa TaxID=4236 RepID=UPI000CD9AB14|nr:uncharacterized protein LOC111905174 [Lactuca sativa]